MCRLSVHYLSAVVLGVADDYHAWRNLSTDLDARLTCVSHEFNKNSPDVRNTHRSRPPNVYGNQTHLMLRQLNFEHLARCW